MDDTGTLGFFAAFAVVGLVVVAFGHLYIGAAIEIGGVFIGAPAIAIFADTSPPRRWPALHLLDLTAPPPPDLKWELEGGARHIAELGFTPVAYGVTGTLSDRVSVGNALGMGQGWGFLARAYVSGDRSTLCYQIGACEDMHGQGGTIRVFDYATMFLTPVDGGWVVSENEGGIGGGIASCPACETSVRVPGATITRLFAVHQRLLLHSGRKPAGLGDLANPFAWARRVTDEGRAEWVREGLATTGDPASEALEATPKAAWRALWRRHPLTFWIPALAGRSRRKALLREIGADKPFLTTPPSAAPAAQPR